MDPSWSQRSVLICFFRIFARMKKKSEMTHKEAVRTALELLGGKAHLKQIYPVAIKLIGDNTHSVDIKATIRRELNSSPMDFKATPDSEGWWELISYQEEVRNLKEIIEQLAAIPKTNDFMQDFLKEVMHVYKHDIFSLFICF